MKSNLEYSWTSPVYQGMCKLVNESGSGSEEEEGLLLVNDEGYVLVDYFHSRGNFLRNSALASLQRFTYVRPFLS